MLSEALTNFRQANKRKIPTVARFLARLRASEDISISMKYLSMCGKLRQEYTDTIGSIILKHQNQVHRILQDAIQLLEKEPSHV
jgi:hypothetical protein